MSAAHPIARPLVDDQPHTRSAPPPVPRTRTHPPGLYVLSAAEACERFGFYLMLALFTLYLNEHFGFSTERAINWYGWYISAVYFTPLFGGWLGGRGFERRTWVLIGATILGGGYFLLSMGTATSLLASMFVLALGNGLFKPNISTLVGGLYEHGDSRRDEAFGIFYVSVNIGAMVAPIAGETLRYRFGWTPAFLAAAAALALAVLALSVGKTRLPAGSACVDLPPPGSGGPHARPSKKTTTQRVLALLLIGFLVVPFWMAYFQTGSSVTFFARDSIQRVLPTPFFDLREIPPGAFTSLGGFFVLLLTAPLAWTLRRLRRRGLLSTSADKIVAGLTMTGIAFGFLALVASLEPTGRVHALWLVAFYFILTIAELMLSPVGLSLVTKLSPPRWVGLLMGVWFLATTGGNRLAGQIGPLWSQWSHARFFGGLCVALLIAATLLATQLGWLRRVLPREDE